CAASAASACGLRSRAYSTSSLKSGLGSGGGKTPIARGRAVWVAPENHAGSERGAPAPFQGRDGGFVGDAARRGRGRVDNGAGARRGQKEGRRARAAGPALVGAGAGRRRARCPPSPPPGRGREPPPRRTCTRGGCRRPPGSGKKNRPLPRRPRPPVAERRAA